LHFLFLTVHLPAITLRLRIDGTSKRKGPRMNASNAGGMKERAVTIEDLVATGPGKLAGRYLRRFWQPVFHSADIGPGQIKPLRIMSETFTLYRGTTGSIHLVERLCPHRRTQLTAGHVEGDSIRCFYHGWKFEGDGRCVEQPAENIPFCEKVRIRSYPVREYLGLVFAFLGDGEPPEFPLHPEFTQFDGLLEVDSYERDCNYFQNIDNALDHCHLTFVHGGSDKFGVVNARAVKVAQSDWGMTLTFTRDDGELFVSQYGMPNMLQVAAFPTEPGASWLESLFWWVPIDDECHMQFGVHRVPVTGAAAHETMSKRDLRRRQIDLPHQRVAEDILAGRIRLSDVDPRRCDMVRLQDDVAQGGQGRIVDRSLERLGSTDIGVVAIRRIWRQELQALADGAPTKMWKKTPSIRPSVWGLGGSAAHGQAESASPRIVDVRPFVEVEIQRKLLEV
jgi:5,5'-dehydrodivanillate O-demethylase